MAACKSAPIDSDAARRECLLEHGAGDRSGCEAAVVPAGRVVDLYDHNQLGMVRRKQGGKGGRVFAIHIFPSLEPDRCSRFPKQ
jgi:hypothetical protein